MCGKAMAYPAAAAVIETLDGLDYAFDSRDCALLFKKFTSLYGKDFFFVKV
ncbi:hypothetical protein [Nitrososphaera viennensis]|uniref:Uncharacterized protein n=2 Tax=Nitrososphaera viennensis TaxID=1034015 RepID=A0A060HTV9_9ARCH|nr:hypothetical protein [Nitrososphaera viennensis]AIC16532.1 hypothetical protein NVIE_022710 [Nitrososphaera viennensis EN76]UVS68465.1 hypothetical protein NWT39_11205 [Nitrososphaera viennensis]